MKKITEPTWVIHSVGDKVIPLSHHTHGINEYNSLELEINLNIKPELAGHIINEVGLRIANGEKIKDGDIIEEVITLPLAIKEIKGIHGGEKVLRIILPDENSKFPWDEGCNDLYKGQLDMSNILKNIVKNIMK